ncbi:MAG: hypothetical protein JWN45_757 [Acidobacteriaceae bacterium]|nr:hypothetical protein [Acidobacteriaceae bacterium]
MPNAPDPQLIVDLIGPFCVQFKQGIKSGTARIFAPICENHFANLLTDSNDFHLDGAKPPSRKPFKKGYVYEFERNTGPTGAPVYQFLSKEDADQILLIKQDTLPYQTCHLEVIVPCPDYVVPLQAEEIWMHRNKSKVWVNSASGDIVNNNRARSVRFLYTSCAKPPKLQRTWPKKAGKDSLKDASYDPRMKGLPIDNQTARFHIILRYASLNTSPLVDDAYHCFCSMRELYPETLKWRVDFNHGVPPHLSIEVITGSGPRDCMAPLLLSQNFEPKFVK